MEKKKYLMPSMKTVCLRAENPILLGSPATNEKFGYSSGDATKIEEDDKNEDFFASGPF